MCGRYTLTDPEAVFERFGVVPMADTRITPRFNVAPSQELPIVFERKGERALAFMRWGFRPAWMKDAGKRPPPINARAEGLVESPLFRNALQRGRCVIPADGFYEWAAVPGQRRKQPHYFRLKDGGLFGFAGLWTPPTGDQPGTCAIVTTTPNEVAAPVHDRMPVILDPDDEALWLDRDTQDPVAALACLRPYPAERMTVFPVATLVSSPENDGPELLQPLAAAG